MKKPISAPKAPVPRLNSLLHRLQKAQGPDDAPCLDQLMIFLDDPPKDIKNRWEAGAEMCAKWGVETSDTAVWRLYTGYLIEWRVRAVLKIDGTEIEPEALAPRIAKLIDLRTCEMLGNPNTPPAALVSIFRIDLRQKYLELARQKQAHQLRTGTERAMAELKVQCSRDRYAQFVLNQLNDALNGTPSKTRDKINAPHLRANLRAFGIDPDSVYSLDSLFPNLKDSQEISVPKPSPSLQQTPETP